MWDWAKKLYGFVAAAGTWLGIVYGPADLFGLTNTYPWLAEIASMVDRFELLAAFSLVMVLYLLVRHLWPYLAARLSRKSPLKLSEVRWLDPRNDALLRQYVGITNISKYDTVENVSIYLKNIRHMARIHSPLGPVSGDFLLFLDGSKVTRLRPGETALVEYVATAMDGKAKLASEFGPFANGVISRWGDFRAFKFEFLIYSDGYPPLQQMSWIRREKTENGNNFITGIGEPPETEIVAVGLNSKEMQNV